MTELPDGAAERLWAEFCRQGDVDALERLYESLRPQTLRYCRSVLGDAHLAEDVVHTAFARLLARRPPARSDFKRLLLATARNLCRDELRRRRRQSDLIRSLSDSSPDATAPGASGPARAPDPAEAVEAQEALSALRDCLMQLDERDRSLIVLTVAEGESNRAAAHILDWPAADHTITRCIKSIKDKLLRCLKKKGIFAANSA